MSQIQQVKEASDIIQILGERLQLQRAGTSWRALCPFHGEKSPSFFINEQFQRYKCFGCGESGDVFTFLEKYEGMTFGEAIKYLADRAGIQLTTYRPNKDDDLRQELLGVLNLAKEYYHFLLTKHEVGEPARQYLKARGITAESIKLFQLGYSMSSWDGLVQYLHLKKKYSLEILAAAGLVVQGRTGRTYDRFRGRVMFPLANHRGQIVGFSGRLLEKDAKEAKYINSPETAVYHKSQMLYGYAELFQEIRKKKEVVVVEGEIDVISSAQAHVNHVVAIKGSALTQEHLKLLQRAADRVIFALDTDSAGVAATKRAISLAKDVNVELRVAMLPSGKDPDELSQHDPKAWRQAVKGSVSIYEFLLRAALASSDPNTPEGKRHIMLELAPVFGTITMAVEQDVYIKKLAEALNVREELIKTDIDRLKSPLGQRRRTAATTPTAGTKNDVGVDSSEPMSRVHKLEKYVVFLLFHSSAAVMPQRLHEAHDLHVTQPVYHQLITQALAWESHFDLTAFAHSLPDDIQQTLFDLYSTQEYMLVLEDLDIDKEWPKTVKELKMELVKAEIDVLQHQISQLDASGVTDAAQEAEQDVLLQKIVSLQRQLRVT